MGRLHLSIIEIAASLLIYSFVLEPISVLCHELGHAAIALRITKGPVVVEVGYGEAGLFLTFERLTINFRPWLYGHGWRRGFCRFKVREASPTGVMYMALAGPSVTGLLFLIYGGAVFLTRGGPGWIPTTFAFAAFACFVTVLINLDPREKALFGTISPEIASRDGVMALKAYRRSRSRRAVGHRTVKRESSTGDPR